LSLAASVTDILTRQGVTAVLTVRTVGDVDPSTGAASVSESDTTVRSSPRLRLRSDIDEFGGIPVTARAVLDSTAVPTVGSRLGLSGAVYPIEAVRTVANANGAVAYIVGLGNERSG
jgi:hypothetical protein